MNYGQFWNGDYEAAKFYRKKRRMEEKRTDYEAWLQGLYFCGAINATIGNAFREKNTDPFEYPNEPFSAQKHHEMTDEEREDVAHKRDDARFMAYMTDWTAQFNKEFAEKEKARQALKDKQTTKNGGEEHGRVNGKNTGH